MSTNTGASKSRTGRFFEDFSVGMKIDHPTPRTLSDGDRSLYIALTGSRDAVSSASTVSQMVGLDRQPMEPFLVFNLAFGKTVPDISLNAVANLGYADGRFLGPVYAGDTLRVDSEIIGLRETSSGKSGVVYTRSVARNQNDVAVLTWVRWVLVQKRSGEKSRGPSVTPNLPECVDRSALALPRYGSQPALIARATGSLDFWEDYVPGERIDHPGAMTVNNSDHSSATRLYQNTAKVHFDGHLMQSNGTGKRLVYGGHVISICRSLAYDGLENVLGVLALNAGSHVAPTHAGDTVCCATSVVERIELGDPYVGALRLRTVGAINLDAPGQIIFPRKGADKSESAGVVLDIDYTVAIPKKPNTP